MFILQTPGMLTRILFCSCSILVVKKEKQLKIFRLMTALSDVLTLAIFRLQTDFNIIRIYANLYNMCFYIYIHVHKFISFI